MVSARFAIVLSTIILVFSIALQFAIWALGISSIAPIPVFLSVFVVFLFTRRRSKTGGEVSRKEPTAPKKKGSGIFRSVQKSKKGKNYVHPLLNVRLKGPTEPVSWVEFSPDHKHLAVCSSDRILRLFRTSTFKDTNHRCQHINLVEDYATSCSFSQDGSLLIVAFHTTRKIVAYTYGAKERQEEPKESRLAWLKLWEITNAHSEPMVSLQLSLPGNYMLSCSEGISVKLWNARDRSVLADLQTNQISNNMARMSVDERFIAVGANLGDVKIWEVETLRKGGGFLRVAKALELKGHYGGVQCLDFSQDCNRLGTVSKDGKCRIWDINVRYKQGADAVLLYTISSFIAAPPQAIAICPNGLCMAVSNGTTLNFFSFKDGSPLMENIEDVHKGVVRSMRWQNDGNLLACGSADKTVTVWSNPMTSR